MDARTAHVTEMLRKNQAGMRFLEDDRERDRDGDCEIQRDFKREHELAFLP